MTPNAIVSVKLRFTALSFFTVYELRGQIAAFVPIVNLENVTRQL
jgi:hypothetical protein